MSNFGKNKRAYSAHRTISRKLPVLNFAVPAFQLEEPWNSVVVGIVRAMDNEPKMQMSLEKSRCHLIARI